MSDPRDRPPAPLAVLQSALALSGDAHALTDGDGRIEWLDERFTALTGHDAASALGLPLLELLRGPRTDAAGHAAALAALAACRDLAPCELEHRRRSGEAFRDRVAAHALGPGRGHVFALRDVSAVHALGLERERLAALLEMAQEVGRLGVWERELPFGKGHWDRHTRRIFGLPEGAGAPDLEGLARLHRDAAGTRHYLASLGRAGRYERRYSIAQPDAGTRHVHSVWQVENGADGAPARALGIVVDDTETWSLAERVDRTSEQLRMAVEVGGIAIFRHDLKARLIGMNDQGYALLGLAPRAGGLTQHEWRSLVHPDDLARVRASAEQSLRGERAPDLQARYRRADGTWRTLLMRRMVERAGDGEALAFVGVALDITEQSESARKALELARRLDMTTSAAGVAVWAFRPASGEMEWNEQMWALSGLPRHGAPLLPEAWVAKAVHPADRERVLAEAREWLRERRPAFETELRVLHPDGSVHWLVNRSRRERGADGTSLFGIMLDVTERHRARHALRSADERAALAARAVGIGTWERDERTGEARWDEQMFLLRGLEPRASAPDAVGRIGMVHPDDVATVQRSHERAVGGEAVSYQYRVRWPDGTLHWLAARAMPLHDAGGQLERLIGVNWDITEARNAEDARRERELARRESQAKSQFLARMSHELRTPLNAVLGFTQLLLGDESMPSRRARLEHIRTGGEHLLALINEVLDLSSLEAGQVKLDIAPVPLAEVAREALAMVERLAREREVALDIEPPEGSVLADRTRLRQVLINLLSNAIKYNRRGGRASLRGCREDGASGYTIRIADTGRGLGPEQVAHLFEPFNRLGAEREGIEGSGIGLVIVKVLLERMGGSIEVSSRRGEGSVCELWLPGSAAAADTITAATRTAAPPAPRPAAPSARGRLLYIEDNPVNALLVAELVAQRPGLVLECASDGTSGVARAVSERPDLVLIDMQLPDMEGHEVLKRLRARRETASIPCIALSANAMTEDIERALAAGFADYWTKPIDLGGFLAGIDALFGA
jgi:PAS domain S-box-containing protein